MAQSPEEMFGDVVAYVERARELLSQGEWVELKGLDAEIERVCAAMATLSKEQAQEYLPELNYLRELVGELEADMRVQQEKIETEIKGAGTVHRANRAYAQTHNLAEPKKD